MKDSAKAVTRRPHSNEPSAETGNAQEKPAALMVFANLNVAAFNKSGQQIPELQHSLVDLLCRQAEANGWNLDGVVLETPHGNWRIVKTELGWKRQVV